MPTDDAQVRLAARPCNFQSTRHSQVSNQIIILWILVAYDEHPTVIVCPFKDLGMFNL